MKKLLLCSMLILFVTGCNNREERTGDSFCDRVIVTSNEYSDSRINRAEFRERIEDLSEECPTEMNTVCLSLRNLLDYVIHNYDEHIIDTANQEIKRNCEFELSN